MPLSRAQPVRQYLLAFATTRLLPFLERFKAAVVEVTDLAKKLPAEEVEKASKDLDDS